MKILSKKGVCAIIIVNDDKITIPRTCAPFVSIFDYINFDRSKPRGKLVMTYNGQPASLTGKLKDGDVITVFWESVSEFDES